MVVSGSITGRAGRWPVLIVAAVVAAVVLRLVFWVYTDRIWEDALITLTPAKNVWAGNGLTHHVSEPRVHSFTSPVSVLVPLLGEAFGQGLLLLRLTALVAGAAAILFAYGICAHLALAWPATLLVLAYLGADQLQIFFGMAGMETQIAVMVMLGNVYFLLKQRFRMLGFFIGLGLLTRPEFVFWAGAVGALMLLRHRAHVLECLVPALLVTLPWAVFAQLYYGSVVPHTIHAKTWGGRLGLFSAPPERMWEYLASSWRHIAPFEQWYFTAAAPVPDWYLKVVVSLVIALALAGVGLLIARRHWAMLTTVVALAAFVAYRTAAVINPYFMWYLPPFVALLFVIAAIGLDAVYKRTAYIGAGLAIILAGSYAMHVPFTFPVEKTVQTSIENGVRKRVGELLNQTMGVSDSVVLEPLGYIGIEAFNKTTYDFPGLSSKRVTETIRGLKEVRMGGVISVLKPSHLVMRPAELQEFKDFFPEIAMNYEPIAYVKASPHPNLSRWGYVCYVVDNEFWTLQRISPPPERVAPRLPR